MPEIITGQDAAATYEASGGAEDFEATLVKA